MNSDCLVNIFVMVVCEKFPLVQSLTNNRYQTIYEPFMNQSELHDLGWFASF